MHTIISVNLYFLLPFVAENTLTLHFYLHFIKIKILFRSPKHFIICLNGTLLQSFYLRSKQDYYNLD